MLKSGQVTDQDQRLNEVLAIWYEKQEAGAEPDRAALLARHVVLLLFVLGFAAGSGLAVSNDKTAMVWETAMGKRRGVLQGHAPYASFRLRNMPRGLCDHMVGPMQMAQFSPGGRHILTLSEDTRPWAARTARSASGTPAPARSCTPWRDTTPSLLSPRYSLGIAYHTRDP